MLSRAVIVGALLASSVLLVPPSAHAASTGSGGWYWPVGTENFQGWDGWWEYRPQNPPRWHLAQDMPSPVGHPVYAVGDGKVLESGGDHGYGGVVILLHKTGDGHYFKAVYGHIWPAAGTGKGAHVKAGQVIGHVNGCRHVHFGIHPGKAYPPDRNPYRGHTYTSKNDYGWVDSVKYLRTHPRILKYAAPALPVVATVETAAAPTVLGVAQGSVYWTIGPGALAPVYSRAISGGETTSTEPGLQLPSFDTTRFPATVGPTSFTLADRLPRLTLKASTTAPEWKHAVTLSGRLTNARGTVFTGATILIESSADGDDWTRIGTARTGLTGAYTLSWKPSSRVEVRARFVQSRLYLSAASSIATIAPKPSLLTPTAPRTVSHGRTFTVRGTIVPGHAAGTFVVDLRVQKLVSGAWVDYATKAATCRGSGSGSSYTASLRLPAGSWRLRAQTPSDSRHSAGSSAWCSVTVR